MPSGLKHLLAMQSDLLRFSNSKMVLFTFLNINTHDMKQSAELSTKDLVINLEQY